ncbi:hypothetical protein GLOTRDRAFT_101402 [Gloeophyllum trabeum ATCC 11539]|uniref:Uncharacterized protein n=1 Tax=Gloeophyllum trabeum (strain ATCC 11539 / FP-39264 / Madison 617) TaxID=670483 RepID=S7PUE6_GLOTA|nr:uncharacterized protein GLOTRDRAFT_101402 [Gloeophyllum trabeum ATCC 11539]EPQ51436.1 hypothetical protein GLOTRDRAFT_101402 [Gloeophyllum trabeum ATCC 11539]
MPNPRLLHHGPAAAPAVRIVLPINRVRRAPSTCTPRRLPAFPCTSTTTYNTPDSTN